MTTVNEYFSVPMVHPEWMPVTGSKWVLGYTVSKHGEVRSPLGRTLKPNLQGSHLWLSLRTGETGSGISSARVDRLVLDAFIGPHSDPAFTTPVHLDGNGLNCALDNLAWGSEPVKEPKEPNPVISIDDMELSVRTYNILRREYFHTTEALCKATPTDLLLLRGFSEKSLNEVIAKLAEYGMALAEPPAFDDYEHQAYVDRVVAAAPPIRPRRKARAKTVAPKGGSEVEVLRVYKRGSLQLSVNANGLGELSKKSRLTTDDMATLADLLQRAVEMNRIMGQK